MKVIQCVKMIHVTKEAKKKGQEMMEIRRKELILSGEASVFAGINLNNKREEDETYEEYKDRRTTNNNLRKIYNKLGREKCIEIYPQGFAYAIQQALVEEHKKLEKKEAILQEKEENVVDIKIDNDESN